MFVQQSRLSEPRIAVKHVLHLWYFGEFPSSFNASRYGRYCAYQGMAVDANVIIFERIREELRLGKRLKAAILDGYKNSTVLL